MSHYKIAKFWSRIGAFFIDSILLAIIGFVLGFFLSDFFISLGSYGIIVGFIISVAYFTIGNSKITGGQTIGKHATNTKVIGVDDNPLSIPRSFVRSLIVALPYFFAGFIVPGMPENSLFHIIKFDALSLLFLGLLFLLIFNKSTRQSLHDLAVKSFVVKVNAEEESLERARMSPKLFYSLYAFLGVVLAFLIVLMSSNYSDLTHMTNVRDKLSRIDGVQSVSVSYSTRKSLGGGSVTTSLICTLNVSKKIDDSFEGANTRTIMMNEAAKIVIENYPDVDDLDFLVIGINRGYNLGIARYNHYYNSSMTIEEWTETINPRQPK